MKLRTVFVRFYKSFNYDYLRKHHPGSKPDPWEGVDGMWFPFVRVSIDPKVTTIVGANESGKSQLLSAIEKGITGQGIEREDFCRYSHFFTVEVGKRKWPDFGFEWGDLSEKDRTAIREVIGAGSEEVFERFFIFRRDRNDFELYLGDKKEPISLTIEKSTKLAEALPRVFHIDSQIALPDSVPIAFLGNTATRRFEQVPRRTRFDLLDGLSVLQPAWFANAQTVQANSNQLFSAFSNFSTSVAQAKLVEKKSLELARDLILKVAGIDPDAFVDLDRAIRNGYEGHANGIIDRVNEMLAKRLNFPHWWAQDKQFALRVSPREFDLVFTIRDRTGTDYSFAERSQGLKYFLSYYVQYLSHDPAVGRDEILLMDEPDAYLSSQAQQDLVRVFEAFAGEEDGRTPVQVVYVTHSPFLIDKNHAERIRVLEKGEEDEGTRVVRDAAKNHYEPLRSAFGAFVAETAFIGTCNLFVEGIADQVLLAGASNYLRKLGESTLNLLDLNQLTIVPAGSASHVPYLVFLARGRDVEQPAIIALLDSDKAGDAARADLERDKFKRKQLLRPQFILQTGDIFEGTSARRASTNQEIETEDLVPPELCVNAIIHFLRELGADEFVDKVSESEFSKRYSSGEKAWVSVEQYVDELTSGKVHIEKIGFARSLVSIFPNLSSASEGTKIFRANMTALFRRLGEMQRAAMRERSTTNVAQRIERARKAFVRDYPKGAKRERVLVLFEEMENALDNTREGDETRFQLQLLRREFRLDDDLTDPVEDFARFLEALEKVKYAARLSSQSDSS